VPNLFVPGHVVSELRGVLFSGFPFEWDMTDNNLPCTTVQAVMCFTHELNVCSVMFHR
jgi:hypothetical protein